MFGFGKSKVKTPRFTIDRPSEAVSNIMFIVADNDPQTTISVALHKGDGTYLDTVVSMFNNIVDDELHAEMTATYNKMTNVDNQTALRDAVLIINSDIKEAERLWNVISTIPSKFYLSTFGAIVSDGVTWKDLILGTEGEVDRTVFTDYQAFNLSGNESIVPYSSEID